MLPSYLLRGFLLLLWSKKWLSKIQLTKDKINLSGHHYNTKTLSNDIPFISSFFYDSFGILSVSYHTRFKHIPLYFFVYYFFLFIRKFWTNVSKKLSISLSCWSGLMRRANSYNWRKVKGIVKRKLKVSVL